MRRQSEAATALWIYRCSIASTLPSPANRFRASAMATRFAGIVSSSVRISCQTSRDFSRTFPSRSSFSAKSTYASARV